VRRSKSTLTCCVTSEAPPLVPLTLRYSDDRSPSDCQSVIQIENVPGTHPGRRIVATRRAIRDWGSHIQTSPASRSVIGMPPSGNSARPRGSMASDDRITSASRRSSGLNRVWSTHRCQTGREYNWLPIHASAVHPSAPNSASAPISHNARPAPKAFEGAPSGVLMRSSEQRSFRSGRSTVSGGCALVGVGSVTRPRATLLWVGA